MNIEELSLKKILSKCYEHGYIREQEFEYAGIEGTAEIFSYHIVFFRKGSDNKTVAISFDEIEDKYLIKIANRVLKYIQIDIKFGDNSEKILNIYGTPRSSDDYLTDGIRYHYLISLDCFLSFGLVHDKLAYMEIIKDKEIIAEVLTVR